MVFVLEVIGLVAMFLFVIFLIVALLGIAVVKIAVEAVIEWLEGRRHDGQG